MIFINLMVAMISFTHVFKVFNNSFILSKTWKRFQYFDWRFSVRLTFWLPLVKHKLKFRFSPQIPKMKTQWRNLLIDLFIIHK